MGQDTCIAVVGVTRAQVEEANARLTKHFGPQSEVFAFTFWEDPAGESRTEGYMDCPEAWFSSAYPEGRWPRIAAYLDAARLAWPQEVVWYYSDAGAPTDGYELGPELIESGWALWNDPEVHRQWWSIPDGCDHEGVQVAVTPGAGDLPATRSSLHGAVACTCGLQVAAPIAPEDVELVNEVLRDRAFRPAFLHVMGTAADATWGSAAAAVSATRL